MVVGRAAARLDQGVIVSSPTMPELAWVVPLGATIEHQKGYVPGVRSLTVKITFSLRLTSMEPANGRPTDGPIIML